MAKKGPEAGATAEKIIQRPFEEAIHDSIMPYAEYVILERALPRVEDGLKPVQRRILYTMMELGLTPDKPHRKSARIVGDTLGKYHPHGDTSVYEAMVRMAQDFNMRCPLVDGHGNFGSVDGDEAAAMRYTEARMTPLALELLRDIDKDTVPFSLNFDDTLQEPDMLPGRFPNLLVNGASGIAVGLATNIPPHNLGEVIDGVVAMIKEPNISLEKLMRYIKAPDFPTGGYIIGADSCVQMYATGRGKVTMRAKAEIEQVSGGKKRIVITELPYQVNKAAMLEKILKLSEEKKAALSGISDIRDESDRNGMRAVIDLKKDADAEKILNYLYKYSDLQCTFSANIVAIANGRPQQMGLLDICRYYIDYQKKIVTRRTKFELENAKKREHILAGLLIAVANLDAVIKLIRSSKTPAEAKKRLMPEFGLTDVQAQAILDLRLQRLTGLEIETIRQEHEQIVKQIARLEAILASEALLLEVITSELLEIKKKHATPRRTRLIGEAAEIEIDEADLTPAEDAVVILQKGGYIKRVPTKAFVKSLSENGAEDADGILFMLETKTDRKLHMFTNLGNCFTLDCAAVPEGKAKGRGALLNSLAAGFAKDERVISMFSFSQEDESRELLFYTTNGMIKRSPVTEYGVRKSRFAAITLKDGAELLAVEPLEAGKTCLFITKLGMSINIESEQVPSMGRVTAGVKAINLGENDSVVFAAQVDGEGEIAVITDRGYAKRSLLVDYEVQGRNGKGLKTFDFKSNGANGYEIAVAFVVKEPFEILIEQKNGETTRVFTEDITIEPRYSKGLPVVMVLMDNIVVSAKKAVSS